MSIRRSIRRYRRREGIAVDPRAVHVGTGAAARRRRKRRGQPAQVTKAVLRRVK